MDLVDIISSSLLSIAPRIVAALIVLLVAWVFMRLLEEFLKRVLRSVEQGYLYRIFNVIKLVVYGSAILIAVSILIPEAQALPVILLIIGLAVIGMFIDVLRNIGAEFYVRSRSIVRRGEWIEVDGRFIRVVDLDALGVVGETPRMERVFIPYTRLINTTIVNRSTPAGLSVKIRVSAPATYGVEVVRGAIDRALQGVSEDFASEPIVSLASLRSDRVEFTIETHVLNYRKLSRIIEELSRRIRESIPEAVVES